jgi:hypothetical protein
MMMEASVTVTQAVLLVLAGFGGLGTLLAGVAALVTAFRRPAEPPKSPKHPAIKQDRAHMPRRIE